MLSQVIVPIRTIVRREYPEGGPLLRTYRYVRAGRCSTGQSVGSACWICHKDPVTSNLVERSAGPDPDVARRSNAHAFSQPIRIPAVGTHLEKDGTCLAASRWVFPNCRHSSQELFSTGRA